MSEPSNHWILRFFRWFCRKDLHASIEGDLIEFYLERIEENGNRKANLLLFWDVLLLFRPGIIKPFSISEKINSYAMFKHHLKISYRHILREKVYSFLNIGGLTIGMTVAILIGLWTWDELSFNKVHNNHEHIAQVMRSGSLNGESFTFPYLPFALVDELKNEYGAGLEHVIAATIPSEHVLSDKEQKLYRKGLYMDNNAPEVFSLTMLSGTRNSLKQAQSILLSESTARDFFGNFDPINRIVTLDNDVELKVSGVYQNPPNNSFMYGIDYITPWELLISRNPSVGEYGFQNNFLNIYVQINPNITFKEASLQIKNAILDNVQDIPDYVKINPQVHLHPMDKWHLYNEWENGTSKGGLVKYVWLFGIIGIAVLLLACINFVNLSTARSVKRAKEVGIKKAIGSLRWQLVHQFITESVVMVSMSFLLSMAIVVLLLNFFNDLAGKALEIPWRNGYFWLASLVFILITSLLSGAYPAFYLSSLKPLKILKSTFRVGNKIHILRRFLVVAQFTVSIIMIIGTIAVYQQVQFVKERPIGYSRENLLMVQMTTQEFYDKYEALIQELKSTGVVEEVAQSLGPITEIWSSNSGFEWEGMDKGWQQEDFATLAVSHDYGKTISWDLSEGRDFNSELASDSLGLVINRSAANLMGFDNPIDKAVKWDWTGKTYRIIGVVEDIVMSSPFSTPMPTIFYLGDNVNWTNIKIQQSTSAHDALFKIEEVFNKIIPTIPFAYQFADQQYELKFKAEERIGKLSGVFAMIAIAISCMGLFGLASYITTQREKEIGIRKVLGASVNNLSNLLLKEFVVLVLVSSFIAIPISYEVISSWLQDYEYKMPLHWWIFAISIVGAFLLTLLTVGFQVVKVSTANPIDSIKND